MDLVKPSESVVYDNLIAGHEIPLLTKGIKLISGQGVLSKGSVLSKDGNGNCKLIALGEEPYGVLTDDIDTDIESVCTMYQQGIFNNAKLVVGDDVESIDLLLDDLRKINILTRKMI